MFCGYLYLNTGQDYLDMQFWRKLSNYLITKQVCYNYEKRRREYHICDPNDQINHSPPTDLKDPPLSVISFIQSYCIKITSNPPPPPPPRPITLYVNDPDVNTQPCNKYENILEIRRKRWSYFLKFNMLN